MILPLKAEKIRRLKEVCLSKITSAFPLHSRMHLMQTLPFYVKREDELGFGISGSKLRKYASILPFLKRERKCVALIGSPYSNHILSFIQLLKQEGIPFLVFLEKTRSGSPKGNFFLLSLLLQKKEIVWVDELPSDVTRSFWEEKVGQSFLWVPMGGCMEEGLLGSLTLPLDILKNEEDFSLVFDHVFVDAGTGMSAIALILGFAYLQKKTKVHVVLMAGDEESFTVQLQAFHLFLQEELAEKFLLPKQSYQLHYPCSAKSFGSTNATVFKTIVETAKQEGIFLDPIYTAKLLLTVKKKAPSGNVLWIHSGGALSLFGFQEPLLHLSSEIL